MAQQLCRGIRQQGRTGFGGGRGWQVEREGQAAGGGDDGVGREHEGEQLQQVVCRAGPQAEAAEGGGCVDQQRRGGGLEGARGGRRVERQQLAIGRGDGGAAMAGHDGGRVGVGGWHRTLYEG